MNEENMKNTIKNEINKLILDGMDINDKKTIKSLVKETLKLYLNENNIVGIEEALPSYDKLYEIVYSEVFEEENIRNALKNIIKSEITRLIMKGMDINDKETIKSSVKEILKEIKEILASYDKLYEIAYNEVFEKVRKQKNKEFIKLVKSVANKLPKSMVDELESGTPVDVSKSDELKWLPIRDGKIGHEITRKMQKKDPNNEKYKKLNVISPKRDGDGKER